jgi:segregation and condensation protein A
MDKEADKFANQEQIHDILFSREIGWQEIVYDLINTEQLDPWNVDIIILTNKYLEKIKELEEDFFISSKVLLAAAFLLRIKSELLLNKYIKSIDEILFGTKEPAHHEIEKIELEDGEIPDLVPKSPLPRFKRVTLKELMESLNKAIVTENRRIKKEIINRNSLRETAISLPKRKFNSQSKTKEIYQRLLEYIEKNSLKKVPFSELIKGDTEERVFSFLVLLHLENQKKIWLEQSEHFTEIHVWPRRLYLEYNPDIFADLIEEFKKMDEEEEKKKNRKTKKK